MATIDVRDAEGKVLEQRELPSELFDGPVNTAVMHQVVVAGAAGRRAGTHSTKTRGEVSGGGRKPWRQKGTGRARQGSIRAPQWVGGGISHGPKPRDYSMRVNKKMKRLALRSALSDAAQSGKLAVIDALSFDAPRTKDAVALLDAFGLTGTILVVLPGPDDVVERSFRNLAHVKVDYVGNLSTYDLLYADRVLFTAGALDGLQERDRRQRGEARVEEEPEQETEGPAEDEGGDDAEAAGPEESPQETETEGGR